MVQGSIQLVLVDLLAYAVAGAAAISVGFFIAGYSFDVQLRWVSELNVGVSAVVLVCCYVAGFIVRVVRDWIEQPFVDDMGEFKTPAKQIYHLFGLQFLEYGKSQRETFDELSKEYTKLLAIRLKDLSSLEQRSRDYIEDDYADRNSTDPAYLSRLGALSTFSGSLALVLFVLAVWLFANGLFVGDLYMNAVGGVFALVPAIFCWIEQEQLLLEVRTLRTAQAITALKLES